MNRVCYVSITAEVASSIFKLLKLFIIVDILTLKVKLWISKSSQKKQKENQKQSKWVAWIDNKTGGEFFVRPCELNQKLRTESFMYTHKNTKAVATFNIHLVS